MCIHIINAYYENKPINNIYNQGNSLITVEPPCTEMSNNSLIKFISNIHKLLAFVVRIYIYRVQKSTKILECDKLIIFKTLTVFVYKSS